MNGTTVLQIPMSKSLRDGAGRAAEEMGFSSLQEAIRVFLTLMAERKLKLVFELKSSPSTSTGAVRYTKLVRKLKGVRKNDDGRNDGKF